VAWVDIFTRKRYRDTVVDSFNYCIKQKGLQVYGWCVMSNHVHCLVSSKTGNLSDTIRDMKRHCSKQILQSIETEPESRREWILFQFKRAAQQ
jgi:REP element-mobilizing transposase RayT